MFTQSTGVWDGAAVLSLQGGLLGGEFPPGTDLPLSSPPHSHAGLLLQTMSGSQEKKRRIDLIAEYDVESQARKEAILLRFKCMRN